MAQAKGKPVCSRCGSDNVKKDAWAEWNAETQQWELSNTYDETYCEECEESCTLNWRMI